MLWQLFISFLKIGAFTFGGGYAMIPLIEREVIDRKGWVERDSFLSLLALAQSAPGPIALNTAVFVGYKIKGFGGAVAAVAGVVIPSFTAILIIATLFADIRYNTYVDAAFKAMRPAVVALIAAPIIGFVRQLHWSLCIVAAAIAIVVWQTSLSPIYLLAAGALVGIIYTMIATRRCKGKQEGEEVER